MNAKLLSGDAGDYARSGKSANFGYVPIAELGVSVPQPSGSTTKTLAILTIVLLFGGPADILFSIVAFITIPVCDLMKWRRTLTVKYRAHKDVDQNTMPSHPVGEGDLEVAFFGFNRPQNATGESSVTV